MIFVITLKDKKHFFKARDYKEAKYYCFFNFGTVETLKLII